MTDQTEDQNLAAHRALEPTGPPTVGSDPGGGFIYIGQQNGPPYKLTVGEAYVLLKDVTWHLIRALSGDGPLA